jgi:hypothetical protein
VLAKDEVLDARTLEEAGMTEPVVSKTMRATAICLEKGMMNSTVDVAICWQHQRLLYIVRMTQLCLIIRCESGIAVMVEYCVLILEQSADRMFSNYSVAMYATRKT